MEFQRNGHPLVFFDAAVIMGPEIGQLVLLRQRLLFQIQPGCVHVRAGNHAAVFQRLLAHHRQNQRFAPVVEINLRTGCHFHAPLIGHKALRLGHFHSQFHSLPLRAGLIQEFLVFFRILFHYQTLFRVDAVVTVFRLIEQLIPVIFGFGFHVP